MNTDNKKQTQMQPRVTIFKNIKETITETKVSKMADLNHV